MQRIPKIIITDTHFGRYNNSINFLNSQSLIFNDLIEYIKTVKNDRFDLIHLGDIFESRSTLSVYILSKVKDILKNIYSELKKRNPDNRFIFVAGNHDFYSPTSDAVNSLDTIIRSWFPDAIIVSREPFIDGDDIYIDWYHMNDIYKFKSLDLNKYKRIFTHCNCNDFKRGRIPVSSTVYSGHIHQLKTYHNEYSSDPESLLYNLAPPYSLDFGDSNDDKKGFWVLTDRKPSLFKNEKSIRYRTFKNDQIFNIDDYYGSVERGDNFRLYINEENQFRHDYIEKINEICTDIKYTNIILISKQEEHELLSCSRPDIPDILEVMIPDELKSYFRIVREEVEKQ